MVCPDLSTSSATVGTRNGRSETRPGPTLHTRVDAQSRRTPDTTALVADGERVTYRELARRSDRVREALRLRGVRAETIVGVCPARPLDAVVMVLGVLKSGGAYLPLDAAYPPARMSFLLADAAARVVLTHRELAGPVTSAAPPGTRVLCLEDLLVPDGTGPGDGEAARSPRPGTEDPVSGRDLAYMLYTSGSTGSPKGVAVEHDAVCRYLDAAFDSYLRLDPSSVVLQLAPFTFDPWLRDAIAPLTRGGTVVCISPGDRRDPERVLAAVRAHGVTDLLSVVPSMLAALAGCRSLGSDPIRLRSTLVSGESLLPVRRRYGGRLRQFGRLVNHYGPSECVLIATQHEVREDDPDDADVIGRPIPGVDIRLLDEHGNEVPAGSAGEICIGGDKLARGYWRRPELTAERFVADSFHPHGGRLYRTGDRGRLRPDGDIEFLGRTDFQIKVRGHRIEPQEVELALLGHPTVDRAAVVLTERAPGVPVLVAYYVCAAGDDPGRHELAQYLRGRLPEPMVPSGYVRLDALPLGSSGKVDRAALAALPLSGASAPTAGAADGGLAPVEADIAEVWAETLGVSAVAADDDFFALGGHSLMAADIAARLSLLLDADVRVDHVFRHRTVRRLAAALDSIRQRPAPGISRRDPHDPVPLSLAQTRVFAQQRLYGLTRREIGAGTYVIALAYRLAGPLSAGLLRQALDRIVVRHESLRTVFPEPAQGEPAPMVVPAAPATALPLTVEDVTGLPPGERERTAEALVRAEADRPFDLAALPLARAFVVRVAPEEHILLLAFHHIVADGWAVGVFLKELGQHFGALMDGRQAPMAELPVQMGDFAVWQRNHVTAGVLRTQLGYWRKQLDGLAPPVPKGDRPHPPLREQAAGRFPLTVPAPLTRSLYALARKHGATLFMVVAAAFALLLAEQNETDEVTFGTPVANRTRPETEGLIGVFTNTVAMRVDVSGGPAFSELLRRMRHTAVDAYANADVPFEHVVDALVPHPDPARTPLYQVMFALQNAPLEPPALPGVRVSPYPLARTRTKYELTLSLTEHAGALVGHLDYQRALFDDRTAGELAERLTALLRAAVAA